MSLRRLGASPRPARLGGHRGWSSSPWVPSWMASLGRRHSHRNRPGQGAVSGFVGATPGGPPVGGGAVRRARAEGIGACLRRAWPAASGREHDYRDRAVRAASVAGAAGTRPKLSTGKTVDGTDRV